MSYTLGEAAKATGMSKAAISRAIKNGTLSAAKQDNGSFKIDPAELHRVYPPVPTEQFSKEPNGTLSNGELNAEIRELKAKLEASTQRLADRDEVIDDLRTRLDAEAEERRKTQAQLTALLTDQRPKERRRWFNFGKR